MKDQDRVAHRAKLRDGMTQHANALRDGADEAAAMFEGCDDPTHPFMLGTFSDWVDFLDRVARPLLEADGDPVPEQAAMAMYRKASPWFICCALVMADARSLRLAEAVLEDHPFDAGAAIMGGLLTQEHRDHRRVWRWARDRGLNMWIAPEGMAWTNDGRGPRSAARGTWSGPAGPWPTVEP